jgi:hypothetical protein
VVRLYLYICVCVYVCMRYSSNYDSIYDTEIGPPLMYKFNKKVTSVNGDMGAELKSRTCAHSEAAMSKRQCTRASQGRTGVKGLSWALQMKNCSSIGIRECAYARACIVYFFPESSGVTEVRRAQYVPRNPSRLNQALLSLPRRGIG